MGYVPGPSPFDGGLIESSGSQATCCRADLAALIDLFFDGSSIRPDCTIPLRLESEYASQQGLYGRSEHLKLTI